MQIMGTSHASAENDARIFWNLCGQMVSIQIISTEYYMCENITKGSLQCKSKELKGMYQCNILLQTPYAVLFTIIKNNVYKAPAPFPLAVYLYKSVTNIPLLINLQLHRKGRRKNQKIL